MNNVVRLKEGITNEKELQDFVMEEQKNYDFYDMPQYRWILIPDYKDGKSALVFKLHHSMSDGLGIATFF